MGSWCWVAGLVHALLACASEGPPGIEGDGGREAAGPGPAAPREAAVASLAREAQWLRQELGRLRREAPGEAAAGPERGALEDARGAPPAARGAHGGLLVLTLCMGTSYFSTHCGPFFASFERAYGAAAAGHRVVAFTANVQPRVLEAARERFKPWGKFDPFVLEGPHYPLHDDNAEATYGMRCNRAEGEEKRCFIRKGAFVNNLKSGANVVIRFRQAASYIAEHGNDFQFVAIMDSDMLFVQPLDDFLFGPATSELRAECMPGATCEDARQARVPEDSWDLAFTAYGSDLAVPWAEAPERVGRTKSGFRRINSGMVLLRPRDPALASRFLSRWARVSELLLTAGMSAPESDRALWRGWQDQLVGEFDGNDQAALVLLLCSYATERLGSSAGAAARPALGRWRPMLSSTRRRRRCG